MSVNKLLSVLITVLVKFKLYIIFSMQRFSAKENFLVSNTLNCIPMLLEGEAVLIDLRNDSSLAGRIESTDGHMNIHLKEVVFIDRHGGQHPFNEFMVRERMIRQMHIPEHINMMQRIQDWCDSGCSKRRPLDGSQRKTSQKLSAKQKRTQERHKEILEQISEQKLQKSDQIQQN